MSMGCMDAWLLGIVTASATQTLVRACGDKRVLF